MNEKHNAPVFIPLTPEEMKAVQAKNDFQYAPCHLSKQCANGNTIECSTDEDGATCSVGYAGSGTILYPVSVKCGSKIVQCNDYSGTQDSIHWTQPKNGDKL